MIPGSLPFLVGWPTLRAMKANLNCEHINFGVQVDGYYYSPVLSQSASRSGESNRYYTPFSGGRAYRVSECSATGRKKIYYFPSNAIARPITPNDYSSSHANDSSDLKKFEATKLKNLHLALKHGTATAMEYWLKSAGVWTAEFKRSIDELLLECPCKIAKEPVPHPIVSINLPEKHKQTSVSLDIVFTEGVPVMHAVEKCIGWSEMSILPNRSLSEQVTTFAKIWIHRHGVPNRIMRIVNTSKVLLQNSVART